MQKVSRKKLAEWADLSESQIQRLTTEGSLKRAGKGYDLPSALQALLRRERTIDAHADAKTRALALKNARDETKLKRELGRLIAPGELRAILGGFFGGMWGEVTAIGSRIFAAASVLPGIDEMTARVIAHGCEQPLKRFIRAGQDASERLAKQLESGFAPDPIRVDLMFDALLNEAVASPDVQTPEKPKRTRRPKRDQNSRGRDISK